MPKCCLFVISLYKKQITQNYINQNKTTLFLSYHIKVFFSIENSNSTAIDCIADLLTEKSA